MRPQRRRFVVELKRGSNRASFISTDAAADRFSSAEDALFGPRVKPVPVPVPASPLSASPEDASLPPPPLGRVLRDLHEPPPPPLPELPPPARRGRKPGSKNKPKPVLAAAPPPAVPATAASPSEPPPSSPVPPSKVAAPVVTSRPSAPADDSVASGRRSRLRERSTIFKRYVLGTEPAPGQPGWRGRRRTLRHGQG